MRLVLLIVALFQLLIAGAHADTIDDAFQKHFRAGTYADGAAELEGYSGIDPARAGAARGALQSILAFEQLGQELYRYGLAPPQSRGMMMLPVLRFPVPENPKPEKIDYQALRGIFETLVTDLDAAESSLAKLGDAYIKLPVDLAALRIDFDADGKTGEQETLAGILSRLATGAVVQEAPQAMNVNFDTADIYWMRGYGRFISAFAQFMLAHDFNEMFDKTFHLFFPRAGLATGDKLAQNRSSGSPVESEVGDFVAFIHLVNWPVVDATRLKDVRERLLDMTKLSASSWTAARKETDDDLEWLPSARQKGAMTGAPLADDIIDGWLAVMGEFAAILDGKKLMPHWRFDHGMNVKRMFEESKRFDLVLLISGTDAVDYLEDGPVSDSATWNQLMAIFQGNFLGYALWFN